MRNCIFICLFSIYSSFAQNEKHVFQNQQVKAEYHTKGGLFDGKYVSYYANGQEKAEGNFKENLRVGKWDVWDSTGKIHAQHVFQKEVLKRNSFGFYNYTLLKEEDVLMAKRVWRFINRQDCPPLFADPLLFDIVFDLILRDSLQVYWDDDFSLLVKKDQIKKIIGDHKYMIVGYHEKVDWFFNKKNNVSETRPVGLDLILAPRDTGTTDNLSLGWIYFPQFRKILAAQKVSDKKYPYITNLDDIFWYRHFSSGIYKEANVSNREIASYAKTPKDFMLEGERIEIDMIEMEHDFWLGHEENLLQPKK